VLKNRAFHYIPLDWIVILSLIFYVNWCNIFTVTAFQSLLFPVIQYLLTYFFYGIYYIFHIGKLQRMHFELTTYIQFIKRTKYVCMDVCVSCYSMFYSLHCVIFTVMQ
jgi:hypothetical protein